MATFYRLSTQLITKRQPIKLMPLGDYDSLSPLTSHSPLVKQNMFRVDAGKKWFDILSFADGFHCVISRRLKSILEEEGISGWGSFPIDIDGQAEQDYFAFYPSCVVGNIENADAVMFDDETVHQIDLTNLKDAEIFTPQGTLETLCTLRVKELFEMAKVLNVEFEDYEISDTSV